MTRDKCKACPYYRPNFECDGRGEYWAECSSDKKHRDLMDLLDHIDRGKEPER